MHHASCPAIAKTEDGMRSSTTACASAAANAPEYCAFKSIASTAKEGNSPCPTQSLLCCAASAGRVPSLPRTCWLARPFEATDVKVSEIHGMSQRGGAVTTVVRFGTEPVATMVADHGCVDCVVSFETTEALRNLPFVREGGYLLVADEDIKPPPVLTGTAGMPENAREKLRGRGRFAYPRWPDR